MLTVTVGAAFPAPEEIVQVKVICPQPPEASVHVIMGVYTPAVVGVPVNRPEDEQEMPGGNPVAENVMIEFGTGSIA